MEYKARGYEGGASGRSSRKKSKKAAKRAATFNGVVSLAASDFVRVEACLTNPGAPTQAARQGADMLRKLYK